jgi:hypothetical protein
MVKVNNEQRPQLQRCRDLVRILVSVLVRPVCHAGSATTEARNAYPLWVWWVVHVRGENGIFYLGKDDGVKLVFWAGNNFE